MPFPVPVDVIAREILKDSDESLEYFEDMSGVLQDHYTRTVNGNGTDYCNNNHVGSNSKKRRLDTTTMEAPSEQLLLRGRSFLPVRGGCDVFSTEEWKSSGTSLFCPVKHDLYINLQKYDQITAAQGSFFTADESGNFQNSVVGVHEGSDISTEYLRRHIGQSGFVEFYCQACQFRP